MSEDRKIREICAKLSTMMIAGAVLYKRAAAAPTRLDRDTAIKRAGDVLAPFSPAITELTNAIMQEIRER